MEQAGFSLHLKIPKSYQGPSGEISTKSNVDVDLTVDMLLHSGRLDRVVLMSGDGDFVRLVTALQDQGIWVEVAALQGISGDLGRACNQLTNPLLIPDVPYSPEFTFKQVFRVVSFDLREMVMTTERLTRPPSSLSPDDAAWERQSVRVTREMFQSRRFMPGRIIGWTGADGLSAYHEIA